MTGKTVLPGFIDGHGHLEDFRGKTYLNLGITTCATIEIFQDGPWTLAQKGGRFQQDSGASNLDVRTCNRREAVRDRCTEFTRNPEGTSRSLPRTRHARRCSEKELGYDLIKLNEFLPVDLVRTACDEAHRLGMSVTVHSWDVVESAKAGVDAVEHIWSVGYSSILDVKRRHELAEQRLAGNIEQEIAGSYYETENFDRVIDAMVEHGVAWTPTIAKWLRPLSPSAQRFRARENEILDDPNADLPLAVRTVTDNSYDKLYKRYTREQLDRAKIGFDKANEFIFRFVQAGGLLKEGSDPPRGMAAMLMHEALVMDVEAGVSPMVAIQSATFNVAKAFKRDKDYGSVEPGKIADLSIIEGDPLQDIWMTQNVKMVITGGKVIEMGFHNYKSNFLPFTPTRHCRRT